MPGRQLGLTVVSVLNKAARKEDSTVWNQWNCCPCIFPPDATRPTSVNKPEDGADYGNAVGYRPHDFQVIINGRTQYDSYFQLTSRSSVVDFHISARTRIRVCLIHKRWRPGIYITRKHSLYMSLRLSDNQDRQRIFGEWRQLAGLQKPTGWHNLTTCKVPVGMPCQSVFLSHAK